MPQPNRLIETARGQASTIRAKCDTGHAIQVPGEPLACHLAAAETPEANSGVGAARSELCSVGTEGEARYPAGMAEQALTEGSALPEIPELYATVVRVR